MNILVAEDNPDHCELVELELNRCFSNCEILIADTGEQLLQFLRATPVLPDLILMDIKMPRLNGLETIQAIRRVEAWKKIPIIVNSTSASQVEVDECLRLGASCYLSKPINAEMLNECLIKMRGNQPDFDSHAQ